MHLSRRSLLTAGVALVAVTTSCRAENTDPTPGPSSVSPSHTPTPSPTATPIPPLTDAGQARKVVNELVAAAHSEAIIKVDISATQASLSVLEANAAKTWQWEAGTISQVPSDVEDISQTSFDPDDFKFDDLNRLFGLAGALSGSTSNQELQIVEYTPGQVLMVVATRPESRPVFFRQDATPIHDLDFASQDGMTEGLSDALGGRTQVAAIGYEPSKGLWAEAPDPNDPTIMVRRTRNAKLPTIISQSTKTADKLFSTADISAAVLARTLSALPGMHDKKLDAPVSFTIDLRDKRNLPTIHWDVDGTTVITDLLGSDITSQING